MSAWKILVNNLGYHGGIAPLRVIGQGMSEWNREAGIRRARELGLVEPAETTGRGSVCKLSALGRAFVEGRANVVLEPCPYGSRGFRKLMVEEAA